MTRITGELTTGMVVRLSNGRHEWTGDEPIDAGGTDTGPDPYELLLGSLAVHIEGDFDEKQRKRLAQIAQRCPVHKTLAHGVEFEDHATFGSD
jgi:uncharacterized OsmC-like protein